MNIIGVVLAFVLVLYLNSKDLDMGLSLLLGSIILGLFSNLGAGDFGQVLINVFKDSTALELMIVVLIVSGFGYLLKKTEDMELIINSLFKIFRNGKILSMIMPAMLGTINFPGGAILSAPMVDKSGDKINFSNDQKTVINLFYRHIGFFIYPLQPAIIITGQLFEVSILTIIKYNFLIMLFGFLVSYFLYFKGHDYPEQNYESGSFWKAIIDFLKGFSPILSILILAIFLGVPFYLAVFVGLFIGIGRNLDTDNFLKGYGKRLKDFFINGANYNMLGLIFGVMVFKEMIEASGAVEIIADFLTTTGLPLEVMIIGLGIIPSSLLGVNTASMGILIPIFAPLMPATGAGPYISLLFTTSFLGYLLSPIHLCLVLTKEYFDTDFSYIYRKLTIPALTMLIIGIIQVMFL
ncbi:MAG: DUF401 family protein [Bacillota bacterium]